MAPASLADANRNESNSALRRYAGSGEWPAKVASPEALGEQNFRRAVTNDLLTGESKCQPAASFCRYDGFNIVRGFPLISGIYLCAGLAGLCSAYPSAAWSFERLAEAPLIVTCVVEETTHGSPPFIVGQRVVIAHARLLVLRSYPHSTVRAGERINLDYAALPEGHSGMSGPDVPDLKAGAVFALPLRVNPHPSADAWRLMADEGGSLIIPAIHREPPFAPRARNGREFLLHEIASVLISGTRAEVLTEVRYAGGQKIIAPGLMSLLAPMAGVDEDRWALIAASLLSSFGVPRPTIGAFRSGKDTTGAGYFSGSLISLILQKLGDSAKTKDKLIRQLLINSDIASWGVGVTLREFAQEPSLVRELRAMLKSASPGALYVSRDILGTGQKEILGDATALALSYLSSSVSKPSDLRIACWIIRDFGTDEQFGQLIAAVRQSQYKNQHRYDLLWSGTIWSDNIRERAVLDLLLADQRIYQGDQRYSDIARGELVRIEKK
jgi:hypothetical protein